MRYTLFCLALLAGSLLSQPAVADEPFGATRVLPPVDKVTLAQWKAMPQKFAADAARLEACREDASRCTSATLTLIGIIDRVKLKPLWERPQAAHLAVNRLLDYMSDVGQWGKDNHEVWSSPLSAVETGKGDCEEFVNLKFFVLLQSEFAPERMRLLMVLYPNADQRHIVLGVRLRGGWIILDDPQAHDAVYPEVEYLVERYDLNASTEVATALPEAR